MPAVLVDRPVIAAPSLALGADGWPMLRPTLLSVHRTSALDEGSREIICALDGQRLGLLLYGQRLTREIPPGRHTLRVHNTLVWKTLTFDAPPGGHAHFTVWNRPGVGYYLLLVLLGTPPLGLGVVPGRPEAYQAVLSGLGWAPARSTPPAARSR